MAYATQVDLEGAIGGPERLVQLADFDGNGAVDAAQITLAIENASKWMDVAIAMRGLATPVPAPSSALKKIVAEEAIYLLKKGRGMVTDLDRDDHKERLAERELFRKGLIRADEPTPGRATTLRAGWVDRNDGSNDMLKRKDFDEP